MSDPLTVFSRLHGFDTPQGVFAVFQPERGWCRNIRHISNHDWNWSKKFRLVDTSVKPVVLARWLGYNIKNTTTPDVKVLNLLTLKMWTPKEFIAEFSVKPKKYKNQRGPCGRCGRTISLKKDGKPMKHWCYCQKCHRSKGSVYAPGDPPGCVKGCVNEGL